MAVHCTTKAMDKHRTALYTRLGCLRCNPGRAAEEEDKPEPYLLRHIVTASFLLSVSFLVLFFGSVLIFGSQQTIRETNQGVVEESRAELSRLGAENSRLDAENESLINIAQHNSGLLQDIFSRAEGGLMKTYAMSQQALLEIREQAGQQQEP